MYRGIRRSGVALVLVGLLGIAFFVLTDPRWGLARHWNAGENAVDLANEAFYGTVVGIVGCVVMLLIGLWLVSRRVG